RSIIHGDPAADRWFGVVQEGRLVAIAPALEDLDPIAATLVSAAREGGLDVIVAGQTSGVGPRLHADAVVPGGNLLERSVRALQADGHVVLLATRHGHA